MTTETLERAGEIAKAKMDEINAPAIKAAEEAKAASDAKATADAETQKAKDLQQKEADELKAKDEVRILSAEEATLNDADKKRRGELLEAKKAKDNTPEAKIQKVREESQRRIDEIKSELLAKENQSKEQIKKLEAELEGLKKAVQPKIEEDAKAVAKRQEAERISKYVEEDKTKPVAERREMSEEDLEAWYLESPVKATEWIQERAIRRNNERKAIEEKAKEDDNKNKAKLSADEFIEKQNISKEKLFAKFPNVNPVNRINELKAQGKTGVEISEILIKENPDFRLCHELVLANPKYLEMADGPELIMVEMEKRLTKAPDNGKPKTVTLTEEELQAKIHAEAQRLAALEGEGISSTKGKKVDLTNKTKSESRLHQEKIARKAGLSTEQLDASIARRKKIAGASSFDDPEENNA